MANVRVVCKSCHGVLTRVTAKCPHCEVSLLSAVSSSAEMVAHARKLYRQAVQLEAQWNDLIAEIKSVWEHIPSESKKELLEAKNRIRKEMLA